MVVEKKKLFSRRLNALLDAMQVPPINSGRANWFHRFIKNIGFDLSPEATRKWLSGDSIPKTERLGVLAAELGTTVEYLIGETKTFDMKKSLILHTEVHEPVMPYLMEEEAQLLSDYRRLDRERKAIILLITRSLMIEQKAGSGTA